MFLQNWVLPLLIGLVSTYLLMSILYNNYPILRQKFSDLGALIQLQTSRPVYYVDLIPQNQSNYNIDGSNTTNNSNSLSNNLSIPNNSNIPISPNSSIGSRYANIQYTNSNFLDGTNYQINPHVKINNL